MRTSIPPVAAAAREPSRVPAEGDAVVFQQVLDGALAPADGLLRVAWAGGWPIPTSQGYLFATLDAGEGPYTLRGFVPPGGSTAFPTVPLRSEAGVAWAIVPYASPDGVPYEFVRANGLPFSDPYARHFAYDAGKERSLVDEHGPRLERWPLVGSATIPARTIRVWVPADAPTHFLYAHDGQNVFNPYANYGGWLLQNAAGPSTLVVGIDNSPDRMDEYTHVQDDLGGPVGGLAPQYAAYVEDVVRPFVEDPARYGPPARVGIVGSSLGGLLAWYEALAYPTSYDFAASLSGTMGWGSIGPGVHNETIIEAYGALAACPAPALYLDSGGGPGSGCVDADGDGILDDAPDASDNYCENLQLAGVLEAKGCAARLTYVWDEGAGHNETAWRSRAPAILALFEAL